MSSHLILINGRPGSGKTTMGRLLLEKLIDSAFFDFDTMITVNPFEYGEDLIARGLQNSAAVINSSFEQGVQSIIFASGTTDERHLCGLLNHLKSQHRVSWFYLDVAKDERLQRKVMRARDEADSQKHFDFIEQRMGEYRGVPAVPEVQCFEIEASGLTPEETLEICLEKLAS